MTVVEVHRQIEAIRADRHEPPVVVAEIDANGVAQQHYQVARHERLFAGLVFCGPAP